MRLRQFVFVAEKLAPAVEELTDVLGLEVCYQDPGVGKFGLENALLPIRGNLIEVVAPVEDGTTAGRYLERRGGDGGYMLIMQCEDAKAERERIVGQGVRAVWQTDDDEVQATHFHPADVPGAILSIDTMRPGEDWHDEYGYWRWAGDDWRKHVNTSKVQAMTGVDIQSDNPIAVAARWGLTLDRPVAAGFTELPEIALDNMHLRFVEATDGRGLGIGAIDILPTNRPAVLAAAEKRGCRIGENELKICGVRVNLI